MNVIIPIILAAFGMINGCPTAVLANDSANTETVLTATYDTLQGLQLATYDVLADNGSSRRILAVLSPQDSLLCAIDAGSWGTEGLLDSIYITDRRMETITATWFIADAAPRFSPSPDNDGTDIEFTDRITLSVTNHDQATTERYILRDNQIIIHCTPQGDLRITSVRPKPDDLSAVTRAFRFYASADTSQALDRTRLSALMAKLFPLPGRKLSQITDY